MFEVLLFDVLLLVLLILVIFLTDVPIFLTPVSIFLTPVSISVTLFVPCSFVRPGVPCSSSWVMFWSVLINDFGLTSGWVVIALIIGGDLTSSWVVGLM